MSVGIHPCVSAFVAGRSTAQGLLHPPTPGKPGKDNWQCWLREAVLELPHGKTCLPRLLPPARLCLPCASCHVEETLLTRTQKHFSRFLLKFDVHTGPLGGRHGRQRCLMSRFLLGYSSRMVSLGPSVRHRYVPLF